MRASTSDSWRANRPARNCAFRGLAYLDQKRHASWDISRLFLHDVSQARRQLLDSFDIPAIKQALGFAVLAPVVPPLSHDFVRRGLETRWPVAQRAFRIESHGPSFR